MIDINRYIERKDTLRHYLLRWFIISLTVGILTGSASALFLVALDWATDYRESHLWIISLLPLAGLLIGWLYHHWGQDVVRGNNLLLDEIKSPKKKIPFIMAPLVFITTLLTHLFGGSAGREGTAVQMGGTISDSFSKFFRLDEQERKIMITIGISAGFASVFGTPLAGAIFAIEVLILSNVRYRTIVPSFFVAFIADFTCQRLWGVGHTEYNIPFIPEITSLNFGYSILAGICFGLTAMIFSRLTPFWRNLAKFIKYPPLRPFYGGAIIVFLVWILGTTKYIGLGIPTIASSFSQEMESYDFIIKILLTTFTIGVGFKGGEVTPLFFIGATLGNVLCVFIPLPMALLAGMGFVAVFSGATNTPIACTLMGIELFGLHSVFYIGVACLVAYLASGNTGIYSAQVKGSPKDLLFKRLKKKKESIF